MHDYKVLTCLMEDLLWYQKATMRFEQNLLTITWPDGDWTSFDFEGSFSGIQWARCYNRIVRKMGYREAKKELAGAHT